MKKTKLMLALKSLQMNNADKNKLADTIIDIGNNSNGGGNETGVKPYYHRLKTPIVIKDNIDIAMSLSVIGCGTFIVTNPTNGNILADAISVYKDVTYPSIAMMYYDVPLYMAAGDEKTSYSVKFIGDLVTRFMKFASILGSNLTYDQIVASLSQMIEPITEEEFF